MVTKTALQLHLISFYRLCITEVFRHSYTNIVSNTIFHIILNHGINATVTYTNPWFTLIYLQMELTQIVICILRMPNSIAICLFCKTMKAKRKLIYDDGKKSNESVNTSAYNIDSLSVVSPNNSKKTCLPNNYMQNYVEVQKQPNQQRIDCFTKAYNYTNASSYNVTQNYGHQHENDTLGYPYVCYTKDGGPANPSTYIPDTPRQPENISNPYEKTKRKGVFFRSLMPNEKKSSIFFTSSANAKTPPMNTSQGLQTVNEMEGHTNSNTSTTKQMQNLCCSSIHMNCHKQVDSQHPTMTTDKDDNICQGTSPDYISIGNKKRATNDNNNDGYTIDYDNTYQQKRGATCIRQTTANEIQNKGLYLRRPYKNNTTQQLPESVTIRCKMYIISRTESDNCKIHMQF